MEAENYSHGDYINAFLQFMQTGEKDQLDNYLEANRPTAFLSVYRNGFISASVGALESNFPSLIKLWGEEYFSQLAAAYVNASPASAATLVGYGFENQEESSTLSFVEFLQQSMSETIKQFPYAPDVCRLDQAWLESLNENGDSFLSLEKVQELISQGQDLAELPLKLVDSRRIVDLSYDIFDLWGQLRFGDFPKNQSIELNEQSNSVIFWQKDLQVQAKSLTTLESIFMHNFMRSDNFNEASNHALAVDESFDISTLFAELLTAELLHIERPLNDRNAE